MAKKENYESWSVDGWFDDFVVVMVPVPESKSELAGDAAIKKVATANGKPKAIRSKSRKKRATRRRAS